MRLVVVGWFTAMIYLIYVYRSPPIYGDSLWLTGCYPMICGYVLVVD